MHSSTDESLAFPFQNNRNASRLKYTIPETQMRTACQILLSACIQMRPTRVKNPFSCPLCAFTFFRASKAAWLMLSLLCRSILNSAAFVSSPFERPVTSAVFIACMGGRFELIMLQVNRNRLGSAGDHVQQCTKEATRRGL
ncbi:hypothetical protein U1Q18_052175 [Sarracenia purpurea var. burkii]